MTLVAGRYELGQLLGSGGSASVYRARDILTERDVAIKVIPFGEGASEHFERFRHEALALSRLRSRHIARVHDFGRDPSLGLYLAMEFIEGVHLEVAALGRPLLPHEVLRVARGVLDALADAHAAGLVHRDIKPSNCLVPRTRGSLDDVRLLDFGIARSLRRAQVLEGMGVFETRHGVVLGTPAYMAPEQLVDGAVGPATDVYAAGLMLFDLLGVGPLLPGATLRDQIVARLTKEPVVRERVPGPLGDLLARMLARDPRQRFTDGAQALAAIGDLETAPVEPTELLAPRPATAVSAPPDVAPVSRAPAVLRAMTTRDEHAPPPPTAGVPSTRAPQPPPAALNAEPLSRRPMSSAFGPRRLCRLDEHPVSALRDALDALDIVMMDALGRRERGEDMGRIARALTLALRLELDAAALVLEPITLRSPVARAIGACVVAPRARRVTRARVEPDKSDSWVDSIDPELGAMLCAFSAALTARDDASRVEARCKRAVPRLPEPDGSTGRTLRMAEVTAGWIAGNVATSVALASLKAHFEAEPEPPSLLQTLLRSMMLGAVAFRGDEHLAREHLERASRMAADSGATLLETRSMVAWGGMLVEIPGRVEQGLRILERATTLLAHGDAPGLENIAEHNRGAALIIQQRFGEAAKHIARARAAARGELSLEHELVSCCDEALAHLFEGNLEAASRVLRELSDERIGRATARTRGFAFLARCLYALLFQTLDLARGELRCAYAAAAEAEADGGDVYLLAELLGILFAAARGEHVDLLARAGEIEKKAQDQGFASFYWFTNLRAAMRHIRDRGLRRPIEDTLERLMVMLVPHDQADAPTRSR